MGVEDRYHDLLERVVTWRARLDVLPRPGEMSDDDASLSSMNGAQYQEARMRMYDILNEIDVHVRSRLDESDIQSRFAALSELYEEWKPVSEVESDQMEDDPGDAILAGRPESFAPTPEEVLSREPGSSAEV